MVWARWYRWHPWTRFRTWSSCARELIQRRTFCLQRRFQVVFSWTILESSSCRRWWWQSGFFSWNFSTFLYPSLQLFVIIELVFLAQFSLGIEQNTYHLNRQTELRSTVEKKNKIKQTNCIEQLMIPVYQSEVPRLAPLFFAEVVTQNQNEESVMHPPIPGLFLVHQTMSFPGINQPEFFFKVKYNMLVNQYIQRKVKNFTARHLRYSHTCLGLLPISGSETLLLGLGIWLLSAVHSLMGSIEADGTKDDMAIVDWLVGTLGAICW